MDKNKVAEKSFKSKALEFIRSLTPKQIGEVLGDGDVIYNEHLDSFFVWRSTHLVRYVNENTIPKLDPEPDSVPDPDWDEEFEFDICSKCGEKIYEPGRIVLDDGRNFHYNSQCNPIKTKE